MDADLLVVGAGAAGLWAAARAAELGARVLLLEKTPRTGTKVLASGGTRCNLTTTLGADDAARLFGPAGERFLRRAFRALPPSAVRERFHALGVPTIEAPLEKVFPQSQRARDVRDALERRAREAGVAIALDAGVLAIEGTALAGEPCWRVRAPERSFEAPRLLLTPGGMSYARTGTTGDGYAWLRALDLPVVPPVPALVPLASPAPWVRELSGVALQDVTARLVGADGRRLGERARPVVFTHTGVSGPAAMDLSEPVARAQSEGRRAALRLVLDLAPRLEREALRQRLIEAGGRAGAPALGRVLVETLGVPRRIVLALLAQAGAERSVRANALDRATRHAVVEAAKGLSVPVDGTLGFDRAEVTAGGLDLRAVDPATMAVRGRPGLFVCGELLDLAGPIGGLNFQAAFATAELAAVACAHPTTR